MQFGQKLIPLSANLDTSPLYLKDTEAFFIKGVRADWQNKSDSSNEMEIKPIQGNYVYCSIELPEGENKVIGTYEYIEGVEGYVVLFNSNGNHLIYRIRTNGEPCEIVYRFCKDFKGITDNPKDYFSEGRITIKSICKYRPDGSKFLLKEMYLVNKNVENIRIVIEDSIATNSFSTPFFDTQNSCCGDRCRLIKIGVPTPNEEIEIIPIPATEEQKKNQNRLYQKMFSFRFKFVNVWGQVSEHGIISDKYYNNITSCDNDASNFPHCLWLKTILPCPEIAQIIIEVSTCSLSQNSLGIDSSLFSEWKKYLTIDLYDQTNPELNWYERVLDFNNKDFEISEDKKYIKIKFCNNRECDLIAKSDIRDQNPAPIKSGSVASLGKGLAFADNEIGFEKIPKRDLDKIKFDLVEDDTCNIKYSRVKVYAVVANLFYKNMPQAVYRTSLNETNVWAFGGHRTLQSIGVASTVWNADAARPEPIGKNKGGSGQAFPDGVRGFRASLSGSFFAESKQYLAQDNDELILTELIDTEENIKEFITDNIRNGSILIQEFDFGLVPSGKYMFRIHGHNDQADIVNTSTFYISNAPYQHYKQNWNFTRDYIKEIIVDTTDGSDYNSIEEDVIAVIADTSTGDDGNTTRVIRGYVYEALNNLIPITQAEVKTTGGNGTPMTSKYTDHNGFYFVVSRGSGDTDYNSMYAHIYGTESCVPNKILTSSSGYRRYGTVRNPNIFSTKNYPNFVENSCNRFFIEGKINECGTDVGISGVPVTIEGARTVFTNSQGLFKIVLHHTAGRIADDLFFSPSATCFRVECADCKPINVTIPITHPICYLPCVGTYSKNLGIFNLRTLVSKGLEFGGRYNIGLAGYDNIRRGYIQRTEDWVVEIPNEQTQGNNKKQRIKVTLPPSFSDIVCKQFSTLVFSITRNLNYSDYIEWAADKVEFIDAAGKENVSNPSKIKIWYRSLNEYNKLRGFKTNTTWNIVDAENNTYLGDVVEFIQQEDGEYLPNGFESVVQHDQSGSYFLIDFDFKYARLKDGVRFKLKRPYNCEIQTLYHEYHFPIKLCSDKCVPRDSDGNIVSEFLLDVFDSYLYPRQIPVVTTVIENVLDSNDEIQQKITEVKNVRTYPYLYEHHSPNDTWGYKCRNIGRTNAVNIYEGRKCNRNLISLTGALNSASDGAINYLHYFGVGDEYTLEEQGWGGIQAMIIRDDGQIMLICEQAVFSLSYNDNRAVVTQEGYIAVPSNNRFSRPERDAGFNYGCQSNDLNTIRRRGSLVIFLDSQRAKLVAHDFSKATEISEGFNSWLMESIKKVNADSNYFWHGNFDNNSERYLLTRFRNDKPIYVNHEIDKNIEYPETIAVGYYNKTLEFLHYVPEYFLSLFGDKEDTQLFSFKNGVPYAHYSIKPNGTKYLNYYGEQCSPVIGVVCNRDNTQVKNYLSNNVYCKEQMFIIEKAVTETNQETKVYSGQWSFAEGVYTAPYLCNFKNPNGTTDMNKLLTGDSMIGRWIKTTFIANRGYAGTFFKLTAIVINFFPRNRTPKKS